mmetsp:Transcript_250/g.631  ORF Transcript_250/g.631 Transcript_250/m.631 type:complete len:446 (-) Transcript_250:1597-2934(-)
MIQRRTSIPQELEDPDDIRIGEAEGDLFEPKPSLLPARGDKVPAENGSSSDIDSLDSNPALTPTPSSSVTAPISTEAAALDFLQHLPREMRNLLAGGIAGMIAKSVVAPMDRIKILYQVSSAEFHLSSLPGVVRNIVETEGLSALWKGNMATMIRVFPYSGVQFMVFDRCKRYFLQEHEQGKYVFSSSKPNDAKENGKLATINKHGLTGLESLVAGMIAGSISVLCTYPLDLTRAQLAVLKQHKQAEGIVTKSFSTVLMENYRIGGGRGLFRGITPTLLGILPYSGIAFSLNEQGKRKIQSLTQRDLTTMERMECGAFAGLIAQTATYPIEVTRRRMQTVGLVGNDTAFGCLKSQKAKISGSHVPSSATATTNATTSLHAESLESTVRHLYQEQGIRGFFKGVSMNWMKGPVAFSISFTTFDTVQGLMESDEERMQRLPKRFHTP